MKNQHQIANEVMSGVFINEDGLGTINLFDHQQQVSIEPEGMCGTLFMGSDGHYKYEVEADTKALNTDELAQEVFAYSIESNSDDNGISSLTINFTTVTDDAFDFNQNSSTGNHFTINADASSNDTSDMIGEQENITTENLAVESDAFTSLTLNFANNSDLFSQVEGAQDDYNIGTINLTNDNSAAQTIILEEDSMTDEGWVFDIVSFSDVLSLDSDPSLFNKADSNDTINIFSAIDTNDTVMVNDITFNVNNLYNDDSVI